MTVRRVTSKRTIFSFRCDGCGLRWEVKLLGGLPSGWRRMRAGAEQADLCPACWRCGLWTDDPLAAAYMDQACTARWHAASDRFNPDLIGTEDA